MYSSILIFIFVIRPIYLCYFMILIIIREILQHVLKKSDQSSDILIFKYYSIEFAEIINLYFKLFL